MSPDSSINSHQRKSPAITMSTIVVQNQQPSASNVMNQMRHHNRASSSMDVDDGVSSATSSTHRPYIFMQSCSSVRPQNTTTCMPDTQSYMQNTANCMPNATKPPPSPMPKSMPKPNNIEQNTTTTSTTAAATTSIMQQRVHPQTNVIYKVSSRPLTPDYAKSYPVMDTTVASSVKGEPELNIGKTKDDALRLLLLLIYILTKLL